MADKFLAYTKRSDFLVCVDSDGCAMDTMDIKHIRCFGPCMVAEWGLEEWRDAILERWNEINLYTMTRGINRFKGLVKALGEIREKYCEIEELDALEKWVGETPELSNAALEREIAIKDNICLRKALAWSVAVNQSIDRLPEEDKRPFDGVLEALRRAYRGAYTDVVLAQDSGSKSFCIGELMKRGYAPDHVLMCGDAPGDLDAAEKNGVYYYPILVRHEAQSWEEFVREGIGHFLDGTYGEGYQQEKREQFLRNLGK